MKIADQMTAELKTLQPDDLMLVHQIVLSLKSKHISMPSRRNLSACRRVREALRSCHGSWTDYVLEQREDRV